MKIARLHLGIGTPATFFHLGCKFPAASQQHPIPANSWCGSGWVDNGWVHDLDRYLAESGFILGNHTVDHIPLPRLEGTPLSVVNEVLGNEAILDTVRLPGDVRLFREPGFAGDSATTAAIAASPSLQNLHWPIGGDIVDVDTCSNNNADPQVSWHQGVDPVNCAHQMSARIDAQCTVASGCIILVHEDDGTNFGDIELAQIMADLGLDRPGFPFRADQITGIPGILPPTHLGPLQSFTSAFGDDDGVGQPLIGHPVASAVPSACKLESGGAVWCAVPAGGPGGAALPLQPPTPWLTIDDPAFGGRVWMADVNGDGLDDLVYLTPQGVWAALSDGQDGFSTPTIWLAGYVYAQLGAPQTIRFGHFYGHSKGQDLLMVFENPTRAAIYSNCGNGFAPLFPREVLLPPTADLATLQTGDLNGDGLDDLLARDPVNSRILVALNGPNQFAAFASWMDFGGHTNLTGWNDPSNGPTVRLVSFGGRTMLTAGTSTGIIFAPAGFDQHMGTGRFGNAWRHLCNQCLTDDAVPGWHPEWQASGLNWVGNAVVFTRASGLEVAFGQIDD